MRKHVFYQLVVLLLCTLSSSKLFAQEKRISGTITDDNGAPLSGATVSVKNSSLATLTDATGQFTLSVPSSAKVVVVSYVGMQSQEVSITGNAIKLRLAPSSSTL